MQEKIIILDFGSQTTQLIGRRVRELDTYCEIVPYNKFPKEDPTIKGVILSGSPFSVYDKDAFKVDLSEIRGKYPLITCIDLSVSQKTRVTPFFCFPYCTSTNGVHYLIHLKCLPTLEEIDMGL